MQITQTEKNQMLTKAVKTNDLEGVKRAIELGADPNTKNHRATRDIYQRPLTYACWHRQYEIADTLIKAGADVNIQDELGRTPLIHGAMAGHIEVIRKLLDAGAEPDIQNESGMTALMYAAFNGDIDAMKLFIEAGADVDIENSWSDTALDILKNNCPDQYSRFMLMEMLKHEDFVCHVCSDRDPDFNI